MVQKGLRPKRTNLENKKREKDRQRKMNDLSKYKETRKTILSGDLIEFAANSILGASIRAATGQNVNHSALAIWMRPGVTSQFSVRDESEARLYIIEAISNGVRLSFLSSTLKKYSGSVYRSRLSHDHDKSRQRIVGEALKLEGQSYDYFSLVSNLWSRTKLDTNRLFCSEAIQIALIRAGVLPIDYSPTGEDKHRGCGIRPGEFGKTNLFYSPTKIL
jgi:hypothetical protein